jgi:hypothetical protein
MNFAYSYVINFINSYLALFKYPGKSPALPDFSGI